MPYNEKMDQTLNTSVNKGIDYSDNHRVIKALMEGQISENAAEVIIGYAQYRNQLTQQENGRHYATREDLKTLQLIQQKMEESRDKHATKDDVELTKLALRKEIEEVKLTLQKEIEEVKLTLQKEIEEVKLTLQKEIEEVRKEIVESSRKTILWISGILLANTGILAGLIVALFKFA